MQLFKLSDDRYMSIKDVTGLKREGSKVYIGHNFVVTYANDADAVEAIKKVADAIGYVDILEKAVNYEPAR